MDDFTCVVASGLVFKSSNVDVHAEKENTEAKMQLIIFVYLIIFTFKNPL